ncbi:methylmalonyl-CoA carboxyltransferase [Candidatus Wirthbacteria bacterium CG2_30_54_11]|uniref:Methylmalonyl-CoA carboxyltransferase n=1 Tax=Candidatus Wirthbacteria bacterium CG2_30_54_11 TaxID=1817892 RepID=A0A1J5IUP5_9BACT|nr:MAG: methylmalonyl-CoA carboxyltransferase [Candidatus Wirthbacteria bacterium CG2_30_54_11]
MKDKIEILKKRRVALSDSKRTESQHEKGRLTARERILMLVDKESFVELDPYVQLRSHNFNLQEKKTDGDGVVTGYGRVNGRKVAIYAQDATAMGGSLGEMHAAKIAQVQDMAISCGCPIIGIIDSGGARIQEGVNSLDGYAEVFNRNVRSSGVVPQIAVIVGPSAGGACYSPALMDFIFMVKDLSYMFITGPQVIKLVTSEEIDFEGLGGAMVHNQKSGVAHFAMANEEGCFHFVKKLLRYLPSNNLEDPPRVPSEDPADRLCDRILDLVPADSTKSYEMKDVIEEIVDRDSFFGLQKFYARNVIIGLARLDGFPVGIVANQPKILAGCLDIDASDKIARFVTFCDAFNIPVVNLVDVPGYLPGVNQEHQGIIRHGAKILYAYAASTIPKISVVLRKSYGGAYIALSSKKMGYDQVIAWPTAELAVMGAEQAVDIVYGRELSEKKSKRLRARKIEEYREKFMNPYTAAQMGQVDMIIDPRETRKTLISSLSFLRTKRVPKVSRKHGSMPV